MSVRHARRRRRPFCGKERKTFPGKKKMVSCRLLAVAAAVLRGPILSSISPYPKPICAEGEDKGGRATAAVLLLVSTGTVFFFVDGSPLNVSNNGLSNSQMNGHRDAASFQSSNEKERVAIEKWKQLLWKICVYLVTRGVLVSLLLGLNMSWTALQAYGCTCTCCA